MKMKERQVALTIDTDTDKERDTDTVVGERQPLSPVSTMLLRPNFYWTVIVMMGSKTKIDVDAVRTGLEMTLIRQPRFSSILVPDKPGGKNKIWQPVKVVTDDHIVVPNLKLQNCPSPDRLIGDYVSSLTTATFPLTRPLWEVHILNVPTAEAEATFVFRIHHSIGDGVSLASVLLASSRRASNPDSLPSLPGPAKRAASRGGGMRAIATTAWAMLVGIWRTLVDATLFFVTAVFLKDNAMPLPGKDQAKLPPKRVVHRTLSLDDVKVVKNVVGCTVNDVFMGITSAGLSRYLSRKFGKSKNETKNLLANIRFRMIFAVNIRPAAGIHALTEMMEGCGRAKWGNRVGFNLLRIPIAMLDDPLDYIRKGAKVARRKVKNNFAPLISNKCVSLVVKIGAKKVMSDMCRRAFRHTTGTFSNVVGPVEEIMFYGHPLVYIAPTVCGLPQAIGIHYHSYGSKVKIVLAVDELVIPDPDQLLDDLEDSLKLIKDVAETKSSA